jgi:hypothetical protein
MSDAWELIKLQIKKKLFEFFFQILFAISSKQWIDTILNHKFKR